MAAASATAQSPHASGASMGAASEPGPGEEFSMAKTLAGVTTIDDAVAKVKDALAKEGFGIITQIDVQSVMKKKLGIDRPPYWILGACNPQKANQAIEAEPRVGLLLPCKVIVYQDEQGAFVVAFARAKAVFGLVGRADLAPLADEVDRELRAAFDAL